MKALFTLLALVIAAPMARADSAMAYCVLSQHDHSIPVEEGPCEWSQRQGNDKVSFGSRTFDFPAKDDGRTYTRRQPRIMGAGPVFNREGAYTLSVYWDKAARITTTEAYPLRCGLNDLTSSCHTSPVDGGGFRLEFSHADQPVFTFKRIGAATTDGQLMESDTGVKWRMTGHRSFELVEVGGFGNRIWVSAP